jgi:purine-binding chemotaxis protein CheW
MEAVLNATTRRYAMTRPEIEAQVHRDEFLSFRLGAEEYAIDILQVQEIRPHGAVTHIANAPDFVKGVINLRGRIVPIIDMRLKLGMPAGNHGEGVIIILDIVGKIMGVVVDAVSDVVALAKAQIRPAPEIGGAVASGLIHGLAPLDDRMLIMVDIARLLSGEELERAEITVA